MLSHRNLMSQTMNYLADVDVIDPGDCMIHAAPLSTEAGSTVCLTWHAEPTTSSHYPAGLTWARRWASRTLARLHVLLCADHGHKLINTPNVTQVDLSNLKTIVYGGAPMYLEDVKRALDLLGPKLVEIYGQGEAPMTITLRNISIGIEITHAGSTGSDRRGFPAPTWRSGRVGLHDAAAGETGEVSAAMW